MMGNRALFLDRDGTLVEPRHYPSRPEELVLYGDIGPALRWFTGEGFRLIVVTNQAGIARGLFTHENLQAMHRHLERELQALGVRIDAMYYCPHHVDGVIADLAIDCECRKPRPGMLLQAAADLHLDLARSWMIGDILDDVEAGNRTGCRTALVDLGTERLPAYGLRRPDVIAPSTAQALDEIRRQVQSEVGRAVRA